MKLIPVLAIVSVAVFQFAPGQASAACADDLKKVKQAIEQLPRSWRKDDALLKIKEAEAALARKDEEACKLAVQAADAISGG